MATAPAAAGPASPPPPPMRLPALDRALRPPPSEEEVPAPMARREAGATCPGHRQRVRQSNQSKGILGRDTDEAGSGLRPRVAGKDRIRPRPRARVRVRVSTRVK